MSKTVRINCQAIDTSPNRKNLLIDADGKQVWIPYSQIERTIRDEDTYVCAIIIPEWLAKQRGLI